MNISFIYETKDTDFIKSIEDEINNNYEGKIKIIKKITSRTKIDIMVLVCDTKEEFDTYISSLKCTGKSVLITENSDSNYIMNCIEVVDNLIFKKMEISEIVKKIIEE